jgi:exodeoxyribonuclease V alpha subunit
VPRLRPDHAVQTLIKVVQERLPKLGFDALNDVQVLTPMHRGPLGSIALNAALQQALNPTGESFTRGHKTLRVGDRVIQTRNDYDNDIFNGDVGRIHAMASGGVEVDFDGRKVALVGEQVDQLDLAYAISIHKSQGSEYPAVLVVLDTSHFVMLRRNLVYTGVTRAQRFCAVVGNPRALRIAVQKDGGGERYTGLSERLSEGHA